MTQLSEVQSQLLDRVCSFVLILQHHYYLHLGAQAETQPTWKSEEGKIRTNQHTLVNLNALSGSDSRDCSANVWLTRAENVHVPTDQIEWFSSQ